MNSKEILNRLGKNKGNLESYLDSILSSNNNIILFGFSGSGKTTLINKLCGSSFSIQPSQSPQCAESIRKGDFIAIDLPAIDSEEDKLSKYKINDILLSNIPVRMICFVIKYEIHIDIIISRIKMFKKIFEDYTNNILIIITECNRPEYFGLMEREIQKMTNYKKIIFSLGKKDDETLLYDKLVNYMTKMNNIPKMLIKSMYLIDLIKTSNYKLFSNEVDYFLKIINLFKEKSEEYENNTEVQRALFFAFKSFKNKFLKKIAKSSIKDGDIINFTYIDNLLLELISYLKLIRYEVFDLVERFKVGLQLGIKREIDKGIKKCPYCGILWVKYDGSSCIRCGMRGNTNYDMLSKETKNYIVKLTDGKFEITEEIYHNKKEYSTCVEYNNDKMDKYLTKKTKLNFPTNPWLLKKNEKEHNEFNEKHKKALIQPVGCIYTFNWNIAEDATDEFIKFLNCNFIKDFTDYYSDIFEIEIELKVIASVSELKKNYKNLKNVISVEKDEKDISRILESFEEYEKLKNDFPENLDMVLENSSVIKDSDELKMKNRKNSILYWLIKLLNEKGYVF